MIAMDAILLGGGLGRRFSESSLAKSPLPKQFQILGDEPVFVHALRSLMSMDCFRQVLVAVPESCLDLTRKQLEKYYREPTGSQVRVVAGGETRQDSSRVALEALERISPLPTRVLIHDACRPYLSKELLQRVKQSLLDRSYGAWIPVIPLVDTLKRVDNHQVVETLDRSVVYRVQTPQVFEYSVIRSLVEKVKFSKELPFTDDASLCEYYGIPVGVFEGDVRNIKLTYDFEIESLRSMLRREEEGEASCEQAVVTTFTV